MFVYVNLAHTHTITTIEIFIMREIWSVENVLSVYTHKV